MNNILVNGLFSTADSYGKGTAAFEIIVMLLVAFILGYLLRYFLSKGQNEKSYKKEYDDLKHEYELLQKQGEIHQNEYKRLSAELDDCSKNHQLALTNIAKLKKGPVKKDNLKKIEGIGPKIEQLLFEAEVYTWDDLANTEISYIQAVLDKAGPNYKVHNPESWPFQAKMAAEGKWDELKKWQDEHKGGRF